MKKEGSKTLKVIGILYLIVIVLFIIIGFWIIFHIKQVNLSPGEIPLMTCGTNLDQPNTVYRLQNDIRNYSAGTCFSISADNVTLEGDGHLIDGIGSSSPSVRGISIFNITSNLYGVKVENITISEFYMGLYAYYLSEGVFNDITSSSNGSYYGVALEGSSRNIFNNINVNSNKYYGLYMMDGSSGNSFTNINANFNLNRGIIDFMSQSPNNYFTNVTANNNTLDGMLISNGYKINNLVAINNGHYGISLGSNNSIINTQILANGLTDIYLGKSGVGSTLSQYLIGSVYAINNSPTFENQSAGKIEFLSGVGTNSSVLNLSDLIYIQNNLAHIGNGFYAPAKISLYGGPGNGLVLPAIFKNGVDCSDCNAISSLKMDIVIFNVTGPGDYSLGETFIGSPLTISLVGSNPYDLIIGNNYVEPGATASDQVDGDRTQNISINGSIDINSLGSYNLTYTVYNTKGESVSKIRVINVICGGTCGGACGQCPVSPGGGGGGGGGGNIAIQKSNVSNMTNTQTYFNQTNKSNQTKENKVKDPEKINPSENNSTDNNLGSSNSISKLIGDNFYILLGLAIAIIIIVIIIIFIVNSRIKTKKYIRNFINNNKEDQVIINDIENLIEQGRQQLSIGNYPGARSIYNKIQNTYSKMKEEDAELYKKIIEFYKKISK